MSALRICGMVSALALLPIMSAVQAAPAPVPVPTSERPDYLIGAGDELQVFVWKNPDLSATVPVRPDGKITTPLVQDTMAQGKTTSELATTLTAALANYVQDPHVTVVVKTVAAPTNAAAIRVIGAAVTPKTVPYHAGLTALDVLIEVGGLNTFASGNHSQLLRKEGGSYHSYPLRLSDLVKSGDLKANVNLMPGDIIRIPERWF